MKQFFRACKEIFFPAYCLDCKRQLPCWELPLFCDECLARISFINSLVCTQCGHPFKSGKTHLCGHCLRTPFAFHLARSALKYQEPITTLISSLKFQKDLTCLSSLAALAKQSVGYQSLSRPDIIIPVPLHKKRLRKRSFNQSTLLAKATYPEHRRIINSSILIRNRATIPQTGLSGRLRRKNLTHAFSVKQPQMVQGKKILLIDDVFTTGSTVDECAKALIQSGAVRVEIFTLARAL